MADYEILGTVVEKGTDKGVQGLRVEAWDRDTRFHDLLGSAITDGAGRFRLTFTDEYFGDYGGDLFPDVFYRVYRDDALILSTQDQPGSNERKPRITVRLEVEPLVERRAGPDRVPAMTAIKALNFVQKSDFRGLRREATDQTKLVGGFLGSMLAEGFKKWDWAPVSPTAIKNTDVINQDQQTAEAKLAAQGVVVEKVERYQPGLNRASLQSLTAAPVRLAPGERVVLYEEAGTIKYYSRVREPKAASVDQAEVARLGTELTAVRSEVAKVATLQTDVDVLKSTSEQARGEAVADIAGVRAQLLEVAQLRENLAAVQGDLAQRNQTIATLRAELDAVKASQELIQRTDLVQRLTRLENDVVRLRPRGPT